MIESQGKSMSKNTRKVSKAKQQAKVEHFSILGLTARMGPVGLHVYAADFLSAAKLAQDARLFR